MLVKGATGNKRLLTHIVINLLKKLPNFHVVALLPPGDNFLLWLVNASILHQFVNVVNMQIICESISYRAVILSIPRAVITEAAEFDIELLFG